MKREPRGFCAGVVGAGAVALFADDEEQAEVALAGLEESFGGEDHGGDDAFGVAGAAAPDEFVILAGREEGRHGIHVGGERDSELVAPWAKTLKRRGSTSMRSTWPL